MIKLPNFFKRIPNFQDTYESKFRLFEERCSFKYHIKEENINIIKEIKNIIVQHKKSPIEFTREDQFVICSNDYSMKTIKYTQLKEMIINAKEFIDKVNNITSKNETIFR